MPPDPQTPKKPARMKEQVEQAMREFISRVCNKYDLSLEMPGDSPMKRVDFGKSLEEKCVLKIRHLSWTASMSSSWEKFDAQAGDLFLGWRSIEKPLKATPTIMQRRQALLECLYGTLKEESDKAIQLYQGSPLSSRSAHTLWPKIDDSPVLFSIESKRIREEQSEALCHLTRRARTATFSKPQLPRPKSSEDAIASYRSDEKRKLAATRSANTSFTSNNSSVFDSSTLASTPAASFAGANDEDPNRTTFGTGQPIITPQPDNLRISGYDLSGIEFEAVPNVFPGVSIYKSAALEQSDLRASGGLPKDLLAYDLDDKPLIGSQENELKTQLQAVFPELPLSLRTAPWAVIYKVTRVCLYADVSLAEIDFSNAPSFDQYDIHQYDKLRGFLRGNTALKGKHFPERCSQEAWKSAFTGNECGINDIALTGSLQFSEKPISLFKFQLQPIKVDLSHRLGRRMGNHRFLELELPLLSGRNLPKTLGGLGERGREIVVEWLVDTSHALFGRTWKPFFTTKLKKKKRESTQSSETANRVYFFAIDGNGFEISMDSFHKHGFGYFTMSIDRLLNLIRPTRKNKNQSYLKLFSRTSLALSRNWATIILERDQILDRDDIVYSSEVMTDGAGRISPTLALKVTQKLGLSFVPTGFQGRIGEAKGFWTVYNGDKSGLDWIETYKSQRKWTRSSKLKGESDDVSHRTFEVVGFSGPLKSKDLNQQILPLLVEQAKDQDAMKKSIEILLKEGLVREVRALRTAMDSLQSFRKWLHEAKYAVNERLKAGAVPYRAAMPHSIEEKLNMFLDGGFHPQEQFYVKDLARKMFKSKCDELVDKLKIKIDRSASVFMVPDFFGVLEPNEVYVNLPSFKDESTGFSGTSLFGEDILVARSPAHFISDIQKVKVVAKAEFVEWKDVIVFPAKGNPSLASKLSGGGDYDGDRAWVCWEPTIVDNFVNAPVPQCPDLVELGYIKKDPRTYAQLVEGHADPSSIFLKSSFIFNMKLDLLGECTNYKEKICWTQRSVSTPESLWLSTLLSSLVDQYKQGLTFGEDDWKRFKNEMIKIEPRVPSYMNKKKELDRNSHHIIDSLRCVASDTVDACLTEFHESFKVDSKDDIPFWDEALAKQYTRAREKGEMNEEWKLLINDLDADLEPLKTKWGSYWMKHKPRNPWEEPTGEYDLILGQCYEIFLEIRPHVDTAFTQALLPDCGDPEQSEWALLRASALFCMYRKEFSTFPWLMGGTQLVKLKARHGEIPLIHTVVASMYAGLKPDSSYIKRYESRSGGAIADEDGGANLEEVDDEDD